MPLEPLSIWLECPRIYHEARGLGEEKPQTDVGWLLFTTRGEDAVTRWRNLAWLVFPPKIVGLKSFDLSRALAWLYWLLRPLRLIWKDNFRSNPGTGITSNSAAGLTTLHKE